MSYGARVNQAVGVSSDVPLAGQAKRWPYRAPGLMYVQDEEFSPLYVAAQMGHDTVVRSLAALGANVNQPNVVGFNCVFAALTLMQTLIARTVVVMHVGWGLR